MKGTEKIIAHINADAKAKADAVIAEAEARCAEISSRYEQEASDRYTAKIRAGVKENESKSDSIARIAKMEARKGVLALKQEMVAESFALAQKKITALPEAEYTAFLAKLAAGAAVTGEEEIVLNARDGAIGAAVAAQANTLLAGKGMPGKLTVAADAGDFAGGLVLRRSTIEVNCTVELLLDLCRDEMSAAVADVLFA